MKVAFSGVWPPQRKSPRGWHERAAVILYGGPGDVVPPVGDGFTVIRDDASPLRFSTIGIGAFPCAAARLREHGAAGWPCVVMFGTWEEVKAASAVFGQQVRVVPVGEVS